MGEVKIIDNKMKGILKTPKKTTWTSVAGLTKEGKPIARIMSKTEAQNWMKETNKSVFKKITVGDLQKL